MKTYQINLSPAAQKQIKKLDPSAQKTIIQKLESLKKNPRPGGIKKLAGLDQLYRIRVGDYRVIYTIQDKELVILVVKVGHRKEIYKLISKS